MGIGKRIKEARNLLGLTQDELASILGITKGAVANYENETSHPKEPIMYKMFDALKVDANFLFQDEMKEMPYLNKATPEEFDRIIRKYRYLDSHGKDIVLMLLQKEYERCIASHIPIEKNTDPTSEDVRTNINNGKDVV